MTLEHLLGLVSDAEPPRITDRFERQLETHTEWGWRDAIAGESGWWWAITSGDRVLVLGWTSGDDLIRDEEIRRGISAVVLPVLS